MKNLFKCDGRCNGVMGLTVAALMSVLPLNAFGSLSGNLVTNGEFEDPVLAGNIDTNITLGGGVWRTDDGTETMGPGSGVFEVFKEGISGLSTAGINPLGSDGLGTGQHLELTRFLTPPPQTTVFQSFVVPNWVSKGQLSFDFWPRLNGNFVEWEVVSLANGVIASGDTFLQRNNTPNWSATNSAIVAITPGDTITLNFKDNTLYRFDNNVIDPTRDQRCNVRCGSHIDQVVFAVPTSKFGSGVLGTVLFGVTAIGGLALRRKALANEWL